ncbi:HTH domain-containing protein [Duganella hordei]|uniref:HTH domain-containing protein n=1 Tax=Duganella hordei TaxID=2865934 RepID=UPI003342285F
MPISFPAEGVISVQSRCDSHLECGGLHRRRGLSLVDLLALVAHDAHRSTIGMLAMEVIMRKQEATKPVKPKGSLQVRAQQAAGSVLPSDLNKIISRGVDLGDGYLLVQLKQPGKAKAKAHSSGASFQPQQLHGVPKVSSADILDLFSRVKSSVSSKGAGTRAAKATAASGKGEIRGENQEFLDQFGRKELDRRTELEEKGELVGSQDLAERMGVSRQAITRAVQDLRMFALDGASGRKLYPAFFADDRVDRRQLQAVSKELESLAGSSKWQFFTNPRLSLGKSTPIEALRKGKFREVLAAAKAFREA